MKNEVVLGGTPMVFENVDVQILYENGKPLFELYSTGMALGYYSTAKGTMYPYKKRIDNVVKNAEITPVKKCSQGVKPHTQAGSIAI